MVTSLPVPPREGVGNYVWNLTQFLASQGHSVQIITRRAPGSPAMETVGGTRIWRPTFFPLYPFHVHVHSLFVNRLIGRIDKEIDIYHLHTPLPPPLETTKPSVVTFHTTMNADVNSIAVNNLQSLLVKLQLPVSLLIEHQLLSRASRISTVASSVAEELEAYGVERQKACVAGNAVNTDIFTPTNSRGSAAGPTVFAAGRLGLRKGFEDLIACAKIVVAQVPNVRFVIAGSGPLETRLRQLISRGRLDDSVLLVGHVGRREEMRALYRSASLFIHPAHYEGLPTVLLEAMACGCPAIATGVSGALDVITHGEDGILVPPRNPKEMADAILSLLADPTEMQRLGDAGRHTVEERFSWQVVGGCFVDLYQEALADSRGVVV